MPPARAAFFFCPGVATTARPRGSGVARKSSRRSGNVVTIHDVARHAGVSPMTVSRVVNGEPNVREVTRALVAAAIKALR